MPHEQRAYCVEGLVCRVGGNAANRVRALGADFWAAARGKGLRMQVRALRKHKLAGRRSRIKAVRNPRCAGAGNVFTCGVLPSILWDANIYGCLGASRQSLRKKADYNLGLGARGRSPECSLLLPPDMDPEARTSNYALSVQKLQ